MRSSSKHNTIDDGTVPNRSVSARETPAHPQSSAGARVRSAERPATHRHLEGAVNV